MKSVIKHVSHPFPVELYRSRLDHAKITGQPLLERPFWYEDLQSGYLYHDIFACIGWPSEVSDKDIGMPGYIGIIGVIRPSELKKDTHYDATDADFLLLREAQDSDIPALLQKCLELREMYGFGVTPTIMTYFMGDPERFVTTTALLNERLIEAGGDRNALLFSPPDDFYTPKVFDTYVRSLRSTISGDRKRFYFGKNEILKNRIKEFRRDDPAILAAGGLIHSLLNRCMWMGQVEGSTAFSVEEEV